MTDPLNRLLRDTVHELADDADVISDRDRHRLAVHAVDRAYTLRARRRGAVAATVALVTALAVGLPYGLRYLDSRTDPGPSRVELPAGVADIPGVPTHVIDDTSKPIELVDGWYVAGNQLVLNPTTRSYESFGNVFAAQLSPNGRWVVTSGMTGAHRVYDLERGGSRRYDVAPGGTIFGSVEWSPDGDALLGTADTGDTLAILIDVTTQDVTNLRIHDMPEACLTCQLLWLPSGTELATVVGVKDGDDIVEITGIQTFALDGMPGALLPIRGLPIGPLSWSPDGRNVLVRGIAADGEWTPQLVEVASGRVIASWAELNPIYQAQWIDNERFLTIEPIGSVLEPKSRVMISLWSIDGTLIERWIPPIEILSLGTGPAPGVIAVHLD